MTPPTEPVDDGATPAKIYRLVSAFIFVVRNETLAINQASQLIDQELKPGFDAAEGFVLWEAASSILTHAANLSKVFWPVAKKREIKVRARIMRTIFEVTDESPLYDRDVRNGFEHLDERIHEWLEEEGGEAVIDQLMGRTADFNDPHFTNKYIFRTWNVETGVVTVGDISANIIDLSREADRLYVKWRELEGKPEHGTVDSSQ